MHRTGLRVTALLVLLAASTTVVLDAGAQDDPGSTTTTTTTTVEPTSTTAPGATTSTAPGSTSTTAPEQTTTTVPYVPTFPPELAADPRLPYLADPGEGPSIDIEVAQRSFDPLSIRVLPERVEAARFGVLLAQMDLVRIQGDIASQSLVVADLTGQLSALDASSTCRGEGCRRGEAAAPGPRRLRLYGGPDRGPPRAARLHRLHRHGRGPQLRRRGGEHPRTPDAGLRAQARRALGRPRRARRTRRRREQPSDRDLGTGAPCVPRGARPHGGAARV